MKRQLNIRVSDQVSEHIDNLQSWLNESQTGVVTTAINQLHEIERSKRMNLQVLTENVARAIARLEIDGIEGWGLGNPDPEVFDMIEVSPATGCTSQTCNHNSHDPASPTYKLIAKSGKLVDFGWEQLPDEVDVGYWALISNNNARFFKYSEERGYWASIRECEEVPDWALAQLAK